jgi:hypothetical protein
LRGPTILIAIAIGRLYQRLISAMRGVGAPIAVFSPRDANFTARGTATERVPDPLDTPAD